MTAPWSLSKYQPRRWQAEALPRVLEAARGGSRGVVSAVMGSGKSFLIAEAVRLLLDGLGAEFKIIITTPTIRLVEQLADTLSEFYPVGRYYTHGKDTAEQVIVCCCASAPKLADELGDVAVWIADEAHRTTSETMQAAAEALQPFSSIGFTATPFCSDARRKLTQFDELVYEYSAQQAMQDGVVVEPRLRHYQGSASDLDKACFEMIGSTDGPGIVNARDIQDAEDYALFLRHRGIAAEPIHSKLSRELQSSRLEALRTSALRCLVHVHLLTEGVDLPWLQWLCLRRPTSSRVAFCQEVGRVLRSAPDKDHALIIDPNDLFNEFSLDVEAMIGCQPEQVETHEDRADLITRELEQPEPDPVILIDACSSYVRRMALAVYARGLAKRQVQSRAWRLDWPSDRQLSMLESLSWMPAQIPDPHNQAICAAMDCAEELSKGDVSDLITVLLAARKLGRWPDLENQ